MLSTLNDPARTRRIAREEVRFLWHCDFWDGPINGVCVYKDERCWFDAGPDADADLSDSPRRYALFRLSPEQLADEEYWHALFREHVGTHGDYDEKNPQVRPAESHRKFYDAYEKRGKVDYSNNQSLGWFDLDCDRPSIEHPSECEGDDS